MFELELVPKKTTHIISLDIVPMNSAFTGTLANPPGYNHLYIKVPSNKEAFAVYRFDKKIKKFQACTIEDAQGYNCVRSYNPITLTLSA